jgi:predicted nucleic acid-binding protein
VIILDTNVLSELLRPEPAKHVEQWLSAQNGATVYFTTIGEAELRLGAAILPAGKRRTLLTTAIEGLLTEDFRDRILSFDRAAARAYASIAAARRAAGHPISQFDCQIAAIALTREAAVATRNISDYGGCGIELINPWQPGGTAQPGDTAQDESG